MQLLSCASDYVDNMSELASKRSKRWWTQRACAVCRHRAGHITYCYVTYSPARHAKKKQDQLNTTVALKFDAVAAILAHRADSRFNGVLEIEYATSRLCVRQRVFRNVQ
jgi:hypothetical protein